ncbi:MAG: GDP-mannose 4,6-dehydratase [Chloroflexi bacterium]|nr:GDP-mannose 4,6-dehydratase [Chloroflexota bacterium]
MRTKVILITGANGEVGHGLIEQLSSMKNMPAVLVLDIRGLEPAMKSKVGEVLVGDILDTRLLGTLISEYEIDTIYHLAALLSTHSEFRPEAAHRVNVQGTVNLLEVAIEQARISGRPVKFIFPSSVAAYGMPDLETKKKAPPVSEDQFTMPTTMYGCNKLYCEHLGRYYTHYYRQLADAPQRSGIDFRSLRFPGLISATTLPTGGTSDYGPEMLHAAAKGAPYACFVRPDTEIPFMAMPDAIRALLELAAAPRETLSRTVYNVTSFSLPAGEIADLVRAAFPSAEITFDPHPQRQGIVDTWPAQMDDSAARRDWGWQPHYDLQRAFHEYLIPTIRQRYA